MKMLANSSINDDDEINFVAVKIDSLNKTISLLLNKEQDKTSLLFNSARQDSSSL